MKRRALPFVLLAAMITCLCGCGGKEMSDSNSAPGYVQPDNDRVNPIIEPKPEWDYYETSNGYISVQSYNGKDKVVTIPDELDGKPVKRLGLFFSVDNGITTTLKIPASVEDIWNIDGGDNLTELIVDEGNPKYYSQDGCIYQKEEIGEYSYVTFIRCPTGKKGEVVLADGTETIGSGAFADCKLMTSVKLPESVRYISDSFTDCTALTSVYLPDSLSLIGTLAFSGCTSLETIDIPESANIYAHAFDGTPFLENLIKQDPFVVINGTLVDATSVSGEAVIPDSVKAIAFGAFAPYDGSNTRLKKVTIPEGYTFLDGGAFLDCEGLEEVVLPESLWEIGYNAFENCVSLKTIELPSGLEEIGMEAFRGCTGLTSLDIPDGVTELSWGAFRDCENLERVSVPDSVVYAGYVGCFEGCDKVAVTFKGETYTAADIDDFYAAVEENANKQV